MNLRSSKAPTAPNKNANWNRRSTIKSEFYRAIAPAGEYSIAFKKAAIAQLEQDNADDLICVYCRNSRASVWDHIYNVGGAGSGVGANRGHHLQNLVPACKACNGAKGKKTLRSFFQSDYLISLVPSSVERERRLALIEDYARDCPSSDFTRISQMSEWHQYWAIYKKIEALLKEADCIAAILRRS